MKGLKSGAAGRACTHCPAGSPASHGRPGCAWGFGCPSLLLASPLPCPALRASVQSLGQAHLGDRSCAARALLPRLTAAALARLPYPRLPPPSPRPTQSPTPYPIPNPNPIPNLLQPLPSDGTELGAPGPRPAECLLSAALCEPRRGGGGGWSQAPLWAHLELLHAPAPALPSL